MNHNNTVYEDGLHVGKPQPHLQHDGLHVVGSPIAGLDNLDSRGVQLGTRDQLGT
jgi:hypothetical protein